MPDLETQIRIYAEELERLVPDVSVPPVRSPGTKRPQWAVAAVAAAVVVAVALTVALVRPDGGDGQSPVIAADDSSAPATRHEVLTGEAARDACTDLTVPEGVPEGVQISTTAFAAASGPEGTVCLTGEGQPPDVRIHIYLNGERNSSLTYDQCAYALYQSGMTGASGIGADMMLVLVPSGSESAVLANGDQADVVEYGGISLVLLVDGAAVDETFAAITKDRPFVETDVDTTKRSEPVAGC